MKENQDDLLREFKRKTEEMFDLFSDVSDKPPEDLKGKPRRRLRLPEAPPLTVEQRQKAQEWGEQELKIVHESYADFLENVQDTSLFYTYLYPHMKNFEEVLLDMGDLVRDRIDPNQISDKGRVDYDELRRIQGRIWYDLYRKYQDE